MTDILLTINNQKVTAKDVLPDTPLLWVLRDHLKMPGTKYGCGVGQCGACTVHLNGQPVRSCLLPVSAIGSAKIRTIEGVANGEVLHALQQAWIELDVPQCGYCQAGQIMSAVALLTKTKTPTDDEIDTAMSGNLCRCATYIRIRKAIHVAASYINKHQNAEA